ncbi:hypothetical protein AAMO2058_001634100 [Amorphochlora amoebiformis]
MAVSLTWLQCVGHPLMVRLAGGRRTAKLGVKAMRKSTLISGTDSRRSQKSDKFKQVHQLKQKLRGDMSERQRLEAEINLHNLKKKHRMHHTSYQKAENRKKKGLPSRKERKALERSKVLKERERKTGSKINKQAQQHHDIPKVGVSRDGRIVVHVPPGYKARKRASDRSLENELRQAKEQGW